MSAASCLKDIVPTFFFSPLKILLQAWPFFGMFMEKFLKEKVQASIQSSNPALKTFTFTKVHFGQKVESFCFHFIEVTIIISTFGGNFSWGLVQYQCFLTPPHKFPL